MIAAPRFAASVTPGVLELACIEVSHSTWAAPQRRVQQPDDWTVTVDGSPVTFLGWQSLAPWRSELPAADDSGRAERSIVLDDADNALLTLIRGVRDSAESVVCTIRLYLSDDLTAPFVAEVYQVETAATKAGVLTLGCKTEDIANLADPYIRHTLLNTPGLRGR